ncbi:Methylenetetrahydrofolate dehydrogenase5 / FY16936)) [Taphrina deformans PYCC 5710]|uniref:Methylenetetrahydrofolate dehydrogenase5 / FY16936 n=1 Tax=Taphrina deformans (strain PYCC 5710 / ATCC 11124 / CBS 356.35 / IMI 108563 / JCM 9778 / NBRC 8474) TaxID=1097556 RepID=R4X856_TAPDE|nr:Methylenetetrahydrofolate dehydrogenase5 / FY16936)) [Taphrina deformans PYCC 5710]|eukprot:CCG81704.1 Methylenetetrahydrofolate dehydrogenase5 / FY16936)) [Taphrina deformans PYCC 5710]
MPSICRVISAASIAEPFKEEISKGIASLGFKPVLRAFLANNDPSAREYAAWTAKTATDMGFNFYLEEVRQAHLEEAIREANNDRTVNGIMNYWPVFPNLQDDLRLQQLVTPLKDVEGFSSIFIENLYSNIRYFDPPTNLIQSILPATPLALVKALEHVGVYNAVLDRGTRLYGKTITIVNRSDIVGRPLAALCANDGATVYSVDVSGVRRYTRDRLQLSCHRWEEVDMTMRQAASQSDVVICGVPSEQFKFPSSSLKDGAVAINFSSAKNFDKDTIKEHASIYIPTIGKVTITMLLRNL